MLKSPITISLKSTFILIFITLTLLFRQSAQAQFAKGADVSWLPQMEATGFKFYNSAGVPTNCLQILKDKDINTIRLRVWVNPSNHKTDGHCSKKETVIIAQRAKAMGMKVMIDFHYSDSWADPGKQTKPAAWASHTFAQLLDDVYNHTFDVLDTLKQCGVIPQWVQIGNEIAGGMLWPEGKLWAPDGSSANWPNLSQLLNKGYDAAKAVDNSIKVIIHLESGADNSKCRWFFDNAKNQGVKYDVIGLSYYPYWIGSDYTATINELGNNMNDMVTRYGKEVMVVEVGGLDTQAPNTYDMLVAVIKKTMDIPNCKGLGVIYWEPQGERNWSGGYPLSCWGADGKPTTALDAFLTNVTGLNPVKATSDFNIYPNPCYNGLINIESKTSSNTHHVRIFDVNGRLASEHTMTGSLINSLQLHLIPGQYFVHIGERNYAEIKKLVIR